MAAAFRAHRARLTSVLTRSGLGTGDADEVTQEAFLILAQRLHDVPERLERAFLTGTALRLASDRRRSAWHRVVSHDWTEVDWQSTPVGANPEELCVGLVTRRRVDALLASLGEQERDVFVLAELEGLSRSEVAHLLHLAPGTVASRLTRARAQLDAALALDAALTTGDVAGASRSCFGRAASERLVDTHRFLTNPWGESKAQGTFEQRLIVRQHHGSEQTGWYWHWPGLDRTVYAYPEVMCGWKPWRGGETTDVRLPARLREVPDLVVDYAVETRALGTYNLAISTWLTGAGASPSPRPHAIHTELMVWPDYTPGALPPGRYVTAIHLGGTPYELWVAARHGRRFARDRDGWTVLTLRGAGGRPRGHLPLGAILADLAMRGLVDAEDLVTCVELGNEVMGGAGTTFVEEFAIRV